ncbi:MAG: hypothetical protein KF809_08450 [Chloroflexi bacterium]|nr:hypothetical protein [Chloroflexota bacterium]
MALAALLLSMVATSTTAQAPSASPDIAASMPPGTTASVQDLDWDPVPGVLGGAIDGFEVLGDPPIAWSGGVAVLEHAAEARPTWPRSVLWREPAVWLSTDLVRWSRHALPRDIQRPSSLLAWKRGLLVVDERGTTRGWWVVLWRSADGRSWRRMGGFRFRARGARAGCSFHERQIVASGKRLVATASCAPVGGSGSRIGPGTEVAGIAVTSHRIASVAMAATPRGTAAAPRPFPRPWMWTSTDGRTWTARRLGARDDPGAFDDQWVWLRSMGGGLVALGLGDERRFAWSSDGVTWKAQGELPALLVAVDGPSATLDARGRPETWFALGSVRRPDRSTWEGLLSRREDGSWAELWGLGGAATIETGALHIQGDDVVAVLAEDLDGGFTVRLWTLRSRDRGATWTVSVAGDGVPSCVRVLVVVGPTGLLGCSDEGEHILRVAFVGR